MHHIYKSKNFKDMKVYASYSKEDTKKAQVLLNALDDYGIEWKDNGINASVFSGVEFSHVLILLTESYLTTNDYRKYWDDMNSSDKCIIIVLSECLDSITSSVRIVLNDVMGFVPCFVTSNNKTSLTKLCKMLQTENKYAQKHSNSEQEKGMYQINQTAPDGTIVNNPQSIKITMNHHGNN